MKTTSYIIAVICFIPYLVFGQEDEIIMDVNLDFPSKTLIIDQKINYKNNSKRSFDTIYLHAWADGYRHKKTTLSKRLIEDYDKSLYFAKGNNRGHDSINKIISENVPLMVFRKKGYDDIYGVVLAKPLLPGEHVQLELDYTVKIPSSSFTGYGRAEFTYNLRFWYLVPAVFTDSWQLMSNKNMDDLFMGPANYNINFTLPEGINLNTDLNVKKTINPPNVTYHIKGSKRSDVEININAFNDFKTLGSDTEVITNLNSALDAQLKIDILNRALLYIEGELGPYPFDRIMVNRVTYDKNPIYGLNQLPALFNPFSGAFEWDIKMFKALTRNYLEKTLLINRRTDGWILDGIQTYLMMGYVKQYYPEITAMGNISKIWGIKSFTIAKLNFNEKYPFVYQFAARRNLDQALTTQADSLSNFNRKIVNKYKAGLGLRYLDEYLNNDIIKNSIRNFYKTNINSISSSNDFKDIVLSATDKDLTWFFGDYLRSKKKIDYTIKRVKKNVDSVTVTIKNNRNFTAPIALYGINKNEIVFRKWIADIDSTASIKLPKSNFSKLALNYEFLYPELNHRDNWENLEGIFNRPIQFRFFKDVEDPYYNQIFYNLFSSYNLYDGLILGPRLYNEALFKKKWLYKITPAYGFKSDKLIGSFSFVYQHLPEDSSVDRISGGISGGSFHYSPDLRYNRLTPFASIQFKRKSLRDVGGKGLVARYVHVDRETAVGQAPLESDSYGVFNLRFGYSKPDIITDLRYNIDFQAAQKFGKLALDFRYRKLTDTNRQYDFRVFAGGFLYNNTDSDFFSFGLDRPSDYLFDYGFLGRSETSGFLSQQIIIAEGGFKSKFQNSMANRWMLSTNGSISLWRWIEAYADAGFYKNQGNNPIFRYDSGIRLNFVHDIFEVYFPLQSSLGFEPSLPDYATKIRFVITLSPGKIIGFLRRGFF